MPSGSRALASASASAPKRPRTSAALDDGAAAPKSKGIKTDNFEQVEVKSAADVRAWLADNHKQLESVWLVTYKKSVPKHYVGREEILDELLCFGWIDGLRRQLDEHRTMQLISPRRSHAWTATYKERAARLEAESRMTNAGRALIQKSKAMGLWDCDDGVDQLIVPADLSEALRAAGSDARAFFDGQAPSRRRNVLRWISGAKTQKTRTSRISQTADLASRGERVPHM